jgi:hypothetical protein
MKREFRLTGAVLLAFVASGCMALSDMEERRAREPQRATEPAPSRGGSVAPATSPGTAKNAGANGGADQRARGEEILKRVKGIRDTVEKAAALEGTDRTLQAMKSFIDFCGNTTVKRTDCLWRVDQADPEARVGAIVGASLSLLRRVGSESSLSAVLVIEPDLDLAEQLAAKAREVAEKNAAARDDEQAKSTREAALLKTARTECDANPTGCKAKCSAGEQPSCFAMGARLKEVKKSSEAKPFLASACSGSIQEACSMVADIEKNAQERTEAIDSSWSEVEEAADNVAVKRHQIQMVRQIGRTPRDAITASKMETITAAIVREKFCPAKKEFFAASNAAEFSRRANAHCANQPPTANGLSGSQITLTALCQASFAAGCP